MTKQDFMYLAIEQAKKAALADEVPVGAIIEKDGKIIARAHNKRIQSCDATAHAEIEAIKKAGKKLKRWNLSGCNLYVTLEPCVMCAGAIINARIKNVFFGAYDSRFGACGSVINPASADFNHSAHIEGGILQKECAELLSTFFQSKR